MGQYNILIFYESTRYILSGQDSWNTAVFLFFIEVFDLIVEL